MRVQCKPPSQPWCHFHARPCPSVLAPFSHYRVYSCHADCMFARAATCLEPASPVRPRQDWEFRFSLVVPTPEQNTGSWKKGECCILSVIMHHLKLRAIEEEEVEKHNFTPDPGRVFKNVGSNWAFSCADMSQVSQFHFQEQHHFTCFCVLQSWFCTFCLFFVHLSEFTYCDADL